MAIVAGISIGNYSIKVVKVKKSLKRIEIISANEYRISGNLEENLKEISEKELYKVDTVVTQLSGDKISIRKLKLPKAAFRNIEQILIYQLEGVIPFSPNDCIIDWQYVKESKKREEEVEIFAIATLFTTVESEINLLQNSGIDPNSILVGPFALGELAPYIENMVDGAIAILDIGHLRSDFCFLKDGETLGGRTLNKGIGVIDKAIKKRFNLSPNEIEYFKHNQLDLSKKVLDPELKPLFELSTLSLESFIKELKQTILSYEKETKLPLKRLYISGGGAKIKGIEQYLQSRLKVDVELLNPNIETNPIYMDYIPYSGVALGTALSAINKRKKRVDLRRGKLAFVKDTSKIRAYMIKGVVYLLILYIGWLFSMLSKYYALQNELNWQKKQLANITKKLSGKEITDFNRISLILKSEKRREEKAPIPEYDVFDILEEMSKLIPQDINHEIERLEIRSGRVEIVGKVDSLSEATSIVKALEGWETCFKNVQLTRTNEILREQRTKYTINIETKCP